MSEDLYHECGVAALYWLDKAAARGGQTSKMIRKGDVAALMPGMLLDVQNRGQLAAGLTSYDPQRPQLLDTYKEVGLTLEEFEGARFSRIKYLQKLIADDNIDNTLRWQRDRAPREQVAAV